MDKIRYAAVLSVIATTLGSQVALASGRPAGAKTYSRDGFYQTMGQLPRDWKSPYPLVGGVPMVDYGTFTARNPVTAAQYGLANYSLWLHYHDGYRWAAAKRVTDWLVRTQHKDGEWEYSFPEPAPGSSETLAPGWASALAQGQALSLLGRVYRHDHVVRYLNAIRSALAPLNTPVPRGGLKRAYDGGIFFEEYPTKQINFSLNGDLQTLIGLYDVSDLVPLAKSLFSNAVATIARSLPTFDSHAGYSYYSLALLTPCPPGYNAAIRDELTILTQVTGRPTFARYAQRWTAP